MFAAMRLPAARRFAGSILRATTPGSVSFMTALALLRRTNALILLHDGLASDGT